MGFLLSLRAHQPLRANIIIIITIVFTYVRTQPNQVFREVSALNSKICCVGR